MIRSDMTNLDTNDDFEVIGRRDVSGKNARFSPTLNEKLEAAANYAHDSISTFFQKYWDDVLVVATKEGISEEDCKKEFRYLLRGKLSKYQIYYLFNKEERKLSEKQRRLEQKSLLEAAKQIVRHNDDKSCHVATFKENENERMYVTSSDDENSRHVTIPEEEEVLPDATDYERKVQEIREKHGISGSERKSSVIGRKEYDALKTEVEMLRAENTELKKKQKDVITEGFLIHLANNSDSDEELGKKVRIQVQEDPRYRTH